MKLLAGLFLGFPTGVLAGLAISAYLL